MHFIIFYLKANAECISIGAFAVIQVAALVLTVWGLSHHPSVFFVFVPLLPLAIFGIVACVRASYRGCRANYREIAARYEAEFPQKNDPLTASTN